MTSYKLTHFKKMVQVQKTKSLLFCLRYDLLIVFWRQNHITLIFIKTVSHDLLVQMAYRNSLLLCEKIMIKLLSFCFVSRLAPMTMLNWISTSMENTCIVLWPEWREQFTRFSMVGRIPIWGQINLSMSCISSGLHSHVKSMGKCMSETKIKLKLTENNLGMTQSSRKDL